MKCNRCRLQKEPPLFCAVKHAKIKKILPVIPICPRSFDAFPERYYLKQ